MVPTDIDVIAKGKAAAAAASVCCGRANAGYELVRCEKDARLRSQIRTPPVRPYVQVYEYGSRRAMFS
jgi:hypothetical protein